MRKIQIERKLFELFGLKFFVFENFQDSDLNIDDKAIYPRESDDELVNIFAKSKFFAIWEDERRLNSSLICACEGNLNLIINFLKKIGIKENAYSTFSPKPNEEPSVLYLQSKEVMATFIQKVVSSTKKSVELMPINFFSAKDNIIYP